MSGDHDRRGKDTDRGSPRSGADLDLTVEVGALADEELVQRAAAGDGVAFSELYRRHEQITWRVARAVTLSDDDAVNAVVEAFSHLVELSPEGVPFRAVMAAAARDGALDQMRRRRAVRYPLTSYVQPGAPTSVAPPSDPAVDLTGRLPSVIPTPPPELWALVQVAWEDRILEEREQSPLARRVVTQLPSEATWHRG
ncbi:MAG: hypothetical protein HYU28_06510 [Actinobacteria bacterium]|nr:hypothetical protein [Actinomycetota bacterium]